MFNKITIKNFKSIGDTGVNIELKPLTILLGPNGGGKSSILEAIGLLVQSVDQSINTKGEFLKVPSINNMVYKENPNSWITFEIYVQLNDNEKIQLRELFPHENIEDINKGIVKYKISYKPATKEYRHFILIGEKEIAKSEFIQITESSWSSKLTFSDIIGQPSHNPDKLFNENMFKLGKGDSSSENASVEIIKLIKSRFIKKISFISAIRGKTKYEMDSPYSEAELRTIGVGISGENLIPVLVLIFGSLKYQKIADKIRNWAFNFDVDKLHAGWKGAGHLSSEFIDRELDTTLNLASASHGSKQILTIITELFWAEQHNIIMIEEPEISLHPNSQALLPDLFADAILDGKQIIITTHSEFLPLTISRPIQKGLLKLADIAIYHVEKGKEGSIVKRLDLTEDGYVKGWIPSFAEVEEQILNEWIKTVPEE